jgi:hypothetical protein
MSEELRPCPFCGGTNICTEKGINLNYCDSCSAEANIEHWNTRPIEDALQARIAELEALVDELVNIGDNLFDSLNPIAWKHEWLDKWWKLSSCRRGEREE